MKECFEYKTQVTVIVQANWLQVAIRMEKIMNNSIEKYRGRLVTNR